MDLFGDDDDFEYDFDEDEKPPRKRRKSMNPSNNLRMRWDIYKQFALAIRQRDKQLLCALLSETQDTKYWSTKQEFIDKYLQQCNHFEFEQPIIVSTHAGLGFDNGSIRGFFSGIEVVVDSASTSERLWRFALVFSLDDLGKIKIKKCQRFANSTSSPLYVKGKKVKGKLAVSLRLPIA